jgi:hypothetical protein
MAKKHNPPQQDSNQKPNKYFVVILGASGAGKTVYMASMYNKLLVQDHNIGFYLSTSPADRRELVARYERLLDHEWPSSTRYAELREWNFTCQVFAPASENGPYLAMEFAYLDYPGEALTASSLIEPMATEKLDNHIKEADALLCVLDGHKVYAGLTGKTLSFGTSLTHDLGIILGDLQGRSTPVQFIITKWDLLVNHNYTMRQVVDYLLTLPQFRVYVESCKQNKIPVRLVPVSSVGMNYVQLNEKGEMELRENGELNPYYTEMPLACVLFDQIEMHLKRLKEMEEETRNKKPLASVKLGFSITLRKIFGRSVITLHDILPTKYQWGEVFVQKISERLEAPYNQRIQEGVEMERQLQAERDASLKNIKDQQTAIVFVLDSMRYLRHKLEQEYPESVLNS